MMTQSKKLFVYEGVLRSSEGPVFNLDNRAFRYGDGLFETIRYHKGEPLFFDDHYMRLQQGMAVLKLSTNGFPSKDALKASISDLVVKSRFFLDARIRLTVFRKGAGLYTPDINIASWIIEATPINETGYSFSDKGLSIDVYKDFPKLYSALSAFKTSSSYPYILAGIYCKDNGFDDCLVSNGNGRLIESVSSNLFWVKDKNVYTPVISSGCIEGVFRKQVIRVLLQMGVKVIENQGATVADILNADEVFLTNSISGVRWVAAFRQKRYYANISRDLYVQLRKIVNPN